MGCLSGLIPKAMIIAGDSRGGSAVTGIRGFLQHITVASLMPRVCRVGLLQRCVVRLLIRDLQLLNDVLEQSTLEHRYWVWGGLLLGWAREGHILEHDCADVDFCVLDEDFARIADAVPALAAAGFRCYRRFVNNAGATTEVTFTRHGIRFEFFRMYPTGSKLSYFLYDGQSANGPLEVAASIPRQKIVPFHFLGRDWLKHEDHAAELTAIYGDWKTPQKDWSYLDAYAVDDRHGWLRGNAPWDGTLEDTEPQSIRA